MENLWITHYLPRRPQRSGWVQVPCITSDFGCCGELSESGNFYFGFETEQPLAQEFVNRLVESHEAKPVDYLYRIHREQRLWLSPEGELWLASQNDPLGDAQKKLVDCVNARYIPRIVWDQAGKYDNLANSLVMQTSITNGLLEAHSGDYLQSKSYFSGGLNIKKPEEYLPIWQKDFGQRVERDARETARQLNSTRPNLDFLPYQEHDYRNVEEMIIGRRIALPFEVIFQTSRRRRTISIIPYGNIRHFALVYLPGSLIESSLELRSEEEFSGRYTDLFERINKLRVNVCAPTHTAVDDLLTDAITERQLMRDLKDDENRVPKLARWIGTNGRNGVIACDTGIAFQIIAAGRQSSGLLQNLRFARFRYEEPLSAGMAYIKEDEIWGQYLKSVISEEFRSDDDEVQASLADFRTRFEEVDGVWTPNVEMCAA